MEVLLWWWLTVIGIVTFHSDTNRPVTLTNSWAGCTELSSRLKRGKGRVVVVYVNSGSSRYVIRRCRVEAVRGWGGEGASSTGGLAGID